MQAAGLRTGFVPQLSPFTKPLIGAELTGVIGAGTWGRSDARTALRNGSFH